MVGILPGQVVASEGRGQRAKVVAAALPPEAWVRQSAGAGSQGERLHDGACVPLAEPAPAGWARWLLVRQALEDPTERTYFRAFGPAATTREALVRVAGLRWAIEEGLAQAKGDVGLDHDEVRTWSAWHRQMTLCLLAHAALVVTCALARRAEEPGGERGARARSTADSFDRAGGAPRVLAAGEDPARQAFLLRCHSARRRPGACTEAHARATPAPLRTGDPVPELLTDAEWARVQPLLLPQKPAVGRPRHDDRTMLMGILWVLRPPARGARCPLRMAKPIPVLAG